MKVGTCLYFNVFSIQTLSLSFSIPTYPNAMMHKYSPMKTDTSFIKLISFKGPLISASRSLFPILEAIILFRQEKYNLALDKDQISFNRK